MKNNLPIESEKKVIDKMGTDLNTFIMTQDNVKKLTKACSVIDANCVRFSSVDGVIKAKAINTKIQNTNSFEIDMTTDVNIKNEKIIFDLSFELFSKVDKEVDEYVVSMCDNNGSKLICFENNDIGFKFYFAQFTGKKS